VAKIILGCVLFIGLVALLGLGFEKMDEGKSLGWPSTDGKLIQIEDRSVAMPLLSRFMPIAIPYAKYSYNVNGKEYIGEKNCGPCLSWIRRATFRPPEMEMPDTDEILKDMKRDGSEPSLAKALEATQNMLAHMHYKPIKVRYQPKNPEESVPDPDVLQGGKSLWYTTILLIGVGGLGLAALIFHGHVTEPVEDPSLSLEGALRAQQQRRR
jgi:hypothetical protein